MSSNTNRRITVQSIAFTIILITSLVALPIASAGLSSPSVAESLESDDDDEVGITLEESETESEGSADVGTLYYATPSSQLGGFTPDGERIWEHNDFSQLFILSDDRETIYSENRQDSQACITEVNAEDGNWGWNSDAGGVCDGGGLDESEGVVYVGGNDNDVAALDAEDGSVLWTHEFSPDYDDGHSDIASLKKIEGTDTLLVGNNDETVIAAEIGENGVEEVNYRYYMGDRGGDGNSVIEYIEYSEATGLFYITNRENTNSDLHAVDLETGEKEWRSPDGIDDGFNDVAVDMDGNTVYGGGADYVELDAETGELQEHMTNTGYTFGSDIVSVELNEGLGRLIMASEFDDIHVYDDIHNVPDDFNDPEIVHEETAVHVTAVEGEMGGEVWGSAVDQFGEPVSDATVSLWGVNQTEMENQLEDADGYSPDDLREEIDRLEEQMEDPLPDELKDFGDQYGVGDDPISLDGELDADAIADDHDATYTLVHTPDDWFDHDAWANTVGNSEVDNPRLSVPSGEEVIISVWDIEQDGDWTDTSVIRSSFYGAPTETTVTIEQLGPDGLERDFEVERDTHVVATEERYLWSDYEWHGVRTSLNDGVYRVYPEGDEHEATYFTVGSPSEIANGMESDLNDMVLDFLDDEQEVQELVDTGVITSERTSTDSEGYWNFGEVKGVENVYVNAYKGNAEVLDYIEETDDEFDASNPPTFEDVGISHMRNYQSEFSYNGSFYLPAESQNVRPPEGGVEVSMYRTDSIPWGDFENYEELLDYLEEQALDEMYEQWKEQYELEVEREKLIEIYNTYLNMIEPFDQYLTSYLNESEHDQVADPETLEIEELEQEIDHMEYVLEDQGSVDPPEIPEEDIYIEDGELFAEIPVSVGIVEDSVTPEVHWNDGSHEIVDDEYWELDESFFGGDSALLIDGYPIGDVDASSFNVRVLGTGDDGSVIDWPLPPVETPEFGGEIPSVRAVNVNTLSPGIDERVTMEFKTDETSTFGEVQELEVFDPEGRVITSSVTSDSSAEFIPRDAGDHRVRAVVTDDTGESFVKSFSIKVYDQSRSYDPTIRVERSVTGYFALVGDGLVDGEVEKDGESIAVSAISPEGEVPGSVHLHPKDSMTHSTSEIEFALTEGDLERSVRSKTELIIHMENVDVDRTIAWRGEPSAWRGEPIAWDGGTRYGEMVDRNIEKPGDKAVIRTFTDGEGSTTFTIDEDPGRADGLRYAVSLNLPRFNFSFNFNVPLGVSALMFTLTSVLATGLAKRELRW